MPASKPCRPLHGQRDRLAEVGARVVRPAMPDAHWAFCRLPWLLAGAVDADGQPWASALCGAPGFIHSPRPTGWTSPRRWPPTTLARLPAVGARIGLLGLQPHSRRRNRANGQVAALTPQGLSVAVAQSFGNCPKYIHPRTPQLAARRQRARPALRRHAGRPRPGADPSGRHLLYRQRPPGRRRPAGAWRGRLASRRAAGVCAGRGRAAALAAGLFWQWLFQYLGQFASARARGYCGWILSTATCCGWRRRPNWWGGRRGVGCAAEWARRAADGARGALCAGGVGGARVGCPP